MSADAIKALQAKALELRAVKEAKARERQASEQAIYPTLPSLACAYTRRGLSSGAAAALRG